MQKGSLVRKVGLTVLMQSAAFKQMYTLVTGTFAPAVTEFGRRRDIPAFVG